MTLLFLTNIPTDCTVSIKVERNKYFLLRRIITKQGNLVIWWKFLTLLNILLSFILTSSQFSSIIYLKKITLSKINHQIFMRRNKRPKFMDRLKYSECQKNFLSPHKLSTNSCLTDLIINWNAIDWFDKKDRYLTSVNIKFE